MKNSLITCGEKAVEYKKWVVAIFLRGAGKEPFLFSCYKE